MPVVPPALGTGTIAVPPVPVGAGVLDPVPPVLLTIGVFGFGLPSLGGCPTLVPPVPFPPVVGVPVLVLPPAPVGVPEKDGAGSKLGPLSASGGALQALTIAEDNREPKATFREAFAIRQKVMSVLYSHTARRRKTADGCC
jgi:hypothetical protein